MVGPAFECPLEVWPEALARVVARMVGITQDPSANPASQLAAVRLVIGLERQIFHAAKEELLARRALDPAALMRSFEPIISIAIIKHLIAFLTRMIHQAEVSNTHAVRAGNLLQSLQKLALDESKWKRIQSTPKPPKDDQERSHGSNTQTERNRPRGPPSSISIGPQSSDLFAHHSAQAPDSHSTLNPRARDQVVKLSHELFAGSHPEPLSLEIDKITRPPFG